MFEDGTWVVWLVIMGLYIGDWMNSKIIMGRVNYDNSYMY